MAVSSSTSVSDSERIASDDEFVEIEGDLKTGDEVSLADAPEAVDVGFAIGMADGDGNERQLRGNAQGIDTGRPTPVASTMTLHGL